MTKGKYLTSELPDVSEIEKAAKDLLLGQEIERKRISMELHDGVIIKLSQIRLHLSKLIIKDDLGADYQDIIYSLKNINEDIRRLSHALHPFALQNQPFQELLEDAIFEASLLYDNINIKLNFKESQLTIQNEVKKHLYYIVLELLHNALQHSFAKCIEIKIRLSGPKCVLIVQDDGIGYNPQQINYGIGLHNIQARVKLINGQFEAVYAANQGMTHRIKFSI